MSNTRYGPTVEVTLSCFGCRYRTYQDGELGRLGFCSEPSIVEDHGKPQRTSLLQGEGTTPDFCPFAVRKETARR